MWALQIDSNEIGILSAVLSPLIICIAVLFRTILSERKYYDTIIKEKDTEQKQEIENLAKIHQDISSASNKAATDALARNEQVFKDNQTKNEQVFRDTLIMIEKWLLKQARNANKSKKDEESGESTP